MEYHKHNNQGQHVTISSSVAFQQLIFQCFKLNLHKGRSLE